MAAMLAAMENAPSQHLTALASSSAADAPQDRRPSARPTPAIPPILLDDEQGAAVYGVGLRTFLDMQNQPWFPRPRLLGPRLKRHVYTELLAAVEHMPRQEERREPEILRRGKIERMKLRGVAS